MERIEVYLDDRLIEKTKKVAKSLGLSVSAFVRQIMTKEIKKYSRKDKNSFASFIKNLEPLESFKNIDAKEYVDSIRSKSRIVK